MGQWRPARRRKKEVQSDIVGKRDIIPALVDLTVQQGRQTDTA